MRGNAPSHLTPTEHVVMQHYVNGMSRETIAAELFVSHHAIDKHLKCAKTKLGARNMAQAGALYAEAIRGDVGPDDHNATMISNSEARRKRY